MHYDVAQLKLGYSYAQRYYHHAPWPWRGCMLSRDAIFYVKKLIKVISFWLEVGNRATDFLYSPSCVLVTYKKYGMSEFQKKRNTSKGNSSDWSMAANWNATASHIHLAHSFMKMLTYCPVYQYCLVDHWFLIAWCTRGPFMHDRQPMHSLFYVRCNTEYELTLFPRF